MGTVRIGLKSYPVSAEPYKEARQALSRALAGNTSRGCTLRLAHTCNARQQILSARLNLAASTRVRRVRRVLPAPQLALQLSRADCALCKKLVQYGPFVLVRQ